MLVAFLACSDGLGEVKYAVTEGEGSSEGDSLGESGESGDSSLDSSGGAWAEGAPCFTYGDPETTGMVVDGELDEISDIVPSPSVPNLLWVHEDAANAAVVTAVDVTGSTVGVFSLQNDVGESYGMVDWEDMALGRCRYFSEEWCLYMGDIGDNSVNRGSVRILEFPEPELGGLVDGVGVVTAAAYDVPYPDGAHNAEALVWSEKGLVILTKASSSETTLYRLDLGGLSMEMLGVLPTATDVSALTTGADLWPDGSRLLVRTYGQVLEFWLSSAGLDDLEHVVRVDLPRPDENQGESASYDRVRGGVWSVSEGVNVGLHFMGCSSVR